MPGIIQKTKLNQTAVFIIYSIISASILSLIFINSTYADNVDFNVSIIDSLNLAITGDITDDTISANLNPSTNPFSAKNITTTVGTNNEYGYTLTMDAATTDLVQQVDSGTPNTIPTLSTAISETDFKNLTESRWGYKNSRSTISTTDYLPFTKETEITSSEEAINADAANLVFATKAGYNTPPGTYKLALTFAAVANPGYNYIQDYDKATCAEEASSSPVTVYDKRDLNDYQVRYINGNCWMVQNLRFTGTELNSSTSNVSSEYTKTSPYKINNTGVWRDLTSGNSYDEARMHNSGNTTNGVWYNYAATSAGTITGDSNTSTQVYDICPKGWRLPSNSEQSSIISYVSVFNPLTGGAYNGGGITNNDSGYWWSATSGGDPYRYFIFYNGSTLASFYGGGRASGHYIRCIRSS